MMSKYLYHAAGKGTAKGSWKAHGSIEFNGWGTTPLIKALVADLRRQLWAEGQWGEFIIDNLKVTRVGR